MKSTVKVMNIALFCAAVVSVLLLSENLFNLMTNAGVFELPACYLILITGATLTPLTWLRSPKDFWLSAVVAGFCTAVTAILIIVGVAQVIISAICGFIFFGRIYSKTSSRRCAHSDI